MINWNYLALFIAGFGAGITWFYAMYLHYIKKGDRDNGNCKDQT